MLRTCGVGKVFSNGKIALENINIEIQSNSVTTILGHNGAGKTTLINILTCYSNPTSGGVYLNGKNIHEDDTLTLGNIGYASINDPLYDELTVFEFLTLIARLKGIDDVYAHVNDLLVSNNLVLYKDRLISALSGGTKRRVSIAMAFIGGPKLIFLDEPSTGVDPENRRALWDSINKLKSIERVIIMTTHHLEEAEFLSEDLIIMAKGQIVSRGSPESIKNAFGQGYSIVFKDASIHLASIEGVLSTCEQSAEIDKTALSSKNTVTINFKQDTS